MAGRLVPDLFLFFKKALYEVKAKPLQLRKRLWIVFLYDFSRKMFLMLYSINWPNAIAWLPLLIEILVNMCIVIVKGYLCYKTIASQMCSWGTGYFFLLCRKFMFYFEDIQVFVFLTILWFNKSVMSWWSIST